MMLKPNTPVAVTISQFGQPDYIASGSVICTRGMSNTYPYLIGYTISDKYFEGPFRADEVSEITF